jgi:hypothetical protein
LQRNDGYAADSHLCEAIRVGALSALLRHRVHEDHGSARRANWSGGDASVELDAIPPNVLRDLVRERIERHRPRDELERLQAREEEERATMEAFPPSAGAAISRVLPGKNN